MKKTMASLLMLGMTACAVCAMLGMEARSMMPAAKVETCRVELGSVEQLLAATGVLRYEMEHVAIAPATGVVAQVYVRQGDPVRTGQPLFRLNGEAQAVAVTAALAGRSGLPEVVPAELASAQLLEAAAQLECLTVRAPADGLVQQVNVTAHGGVMAGTAAVALSGEKQSVQCSVVLRDAEKLREGMKARIIKDGEVLTEAWIDRIGPVEISGTTGQTVCQVCLTPQQEIRLPLGATLDVEIISFGQENVTVLPVQAVTNNGTVWWVADGRSYEIAAGVVMADEVCCWVNLPEGAEVICGGETPEQGRRVKEMSR